MIKGKGIEWVKLSQSTIYSNPFKTNAVRPSMVKTCTNSQMKRLSQPENKRMDKSYFLVEQYEFLRIFSKKHKENTQRHRNHNRSARNNRGFKIRYCGPLFRNHIKMCHN